MRGWVPRILAVRAATRIGPDGATTRAGWREPDGHLADYFTDPAVMPSTMWRLNTM